MYEVYLCKVDGEIVYVGQGVKGRSRHCISGKSHVYGLNETFFSEKRDLMSVEIHSYSVSKKEVEKVEKHLIQTIRPKFNSVYLNTERQASANKVTKFKASMMNDIPETPLWIYSKDGVAYKEVLREFLEFYLYEDFMADGFKLRDRNFYYKFKFNMLSNLVRGKYNENSNSWKNSFKRNLYKHTKLEK